MHVEHPTNAARAETNPAPRPLHLTYCSNIHPGESWAETLSNVRLEATKVKRRLRREAPFALGLRLSARAADELCTRAGALAEFKDELVQLGMYTFTLNGFPYGTFHGSPVKAAVYRPDWRDPARVAYTEQLIQILSALLPSGTAGSISTVPVGFRAELGERSVLDRCVANLLHCAGQLWRAHELSGVDIALAIEPEPACYLETTGEAVAFFERELLSPQALGALAKDLRVDVRRAEQVVRTHVGLCFDTCHAAVEFEDAREAVGSIAAAGVRIGKVQATTGLHVEPVDAVRLAALRSFADPIYLHQVVALRKHGEGGTDEDDDVGRDAVGAAPRLLRFVDLDDAFASVEAGDARCWRVHYHVPVFERAIPPFTNTQSFLHEALAAVVEGELCEQFEVETYTWSVLPPAHRTRELSEMIALELSWVERELLASLARGATRPSDCRGEPQ
ncbi:MAG: hypothetical protein RLZZ450_3105 [Pseudomonadota bacterium]|jgi:sugar phosphate isomerase/epimerase